MFEVSVYKNRRKELISKIESGIILFLGNDDLPVNFPENVYPFRQHSSFLYYFGLEKPDIAAVLDVDSGEEYLFGIEQSFEDRIIVGQRMTLDEKGAISGIAHVVPMVRLFTVLREAQAAGRSIHFLPPYRPENKIKLLRLLNIRPDQFKLKSSEELVRAVIAQREVKSKLELDQIKESVNLSVKVHKRVQRWLLDARSEKDIHTKVEKFVLSKEGKLAFPIMATRRGDIYHNYQKSEILNPGDLFLFNVGFESNEHYASDLTATYSVGGQFSTLQNELYNVLYRAYQYGVSQLKSQAFYKDIYFNTCARIWDGLKEMGIAMRSGIEAVYEGAHTLFIPFGFGHLLGLDVHDMDDLGEIYVGHDGESHGLHSGMRSLLLSKELKKGFALSFEPGLFFIPQLIERWMGEKRFPDFINYDQLKKFSNFGSIRMGENFVIGDQSARRIGKELPLKSEQISV